MKDPELLFSIETQKTKTNKKKNKKQNSKVNPRIERKKEKGLVGGWVTHKLWQSGSRRIRTHEMVENEKRTKPIPDPSG